MTSPKRSKKKSKRSSKKTPKETPEQPLQQNFRSNSQVLCRGRDSRDSGIRSCRIKAHPIVPGGRYCARHQKLCHRCEGSPRHLLTEKCPSCMMRWKKEELEKKQKKN
ncbi:hypothetical protein VC83_08360 [Pseudogymnoascus destructans]|uniref:Uncharacterized protein n=2 Tax=Pseudogymnoascus destructans TaxID=655981 RepID=L8G8E8_PSED2|nr:uncharacterized protein VC83_08360 [Pseudogymnoascus destructans]ELR08296.1 hypothetical protein GMDG_03094 [Pseudogymnoascus destructans 20631-21]OAF55464.1 hypothetical protein VC83_08360 [Pseudogymnoascus destructans]